MTAGQVAAVVCAPWTLDFKARHSVTFVAGVRAGALCAVDDGVWRVRVRFERTWARGEWWVAAEVPVALASTLSVQYVWVDDAEQVYSALSTVASVGTLDTVGL